MEYEDDNKINGRINSIFCQATIKNCAPRDQRAFNKPGKNRRNYKKNKGFTKIDHQIIVKPREIIENK